MCSLIVKKIIVLATYDGDNITMNQEGFDPSRHTEHRVNVKDTGIIPVFIISRPQRLIGGMPIPIDFEESKKYIKVSA